MKIWFEDLFVYDAHGENEWKATGRDKREEKWERKKEWKKEKELG